MSLVLDLPDSQAETSHPSSLGKSPERVSRLSRRAFEFEFNRPRLPVIFTDATENWRALKWTPALLASKVGHREIEYRNGCGKVSFAKLTEQILASSPDTPAPYGRNIHIFRDLPEIAGDVRPRLSYCLPDWKSSRLMPKNWVFENGLEELFYGGGGTSFPSLHVDYWGMDAFISQLYGEKDVLVFAPNDTPYLYAAGEDGQVSAIKDFDDPDLEQFPLYRHATPIRFTLSPGETLFCPNGWWHTTSMPGVSITVVTANWGRANWPTLIQQYAHHHQGKPWYKRKMVMTYLKAVGATLTIRDKLLLGL